jgi:hypothetical protein
MDIVGRARLFLCCLWIFVDRESTRYGSQGNPVRKRVNVSKVDVSSAVVIKMLIMGRDLPLLVPQASIPEAPNRSPHPFLAAPQVHLEPYMLQALNQINCAVNEALQNHFQALVRCSCNKADMSNETVSCLLDLRELHPKILVIVTVALDSPVELR